MFARMLWNIRQRLFSALPDTLQARLRSCKAAVRERLNRFLDRALFLAPLILLCLRNRRKAVVLRRAEALGDVICTLPMCAEIRKRHPGKLLVFWTTRYCESIARMSGQADWVYAARSVYSSVTPGLLGLIEAVYDPKTSDERSNAGPRMPLIDDLADSCGLALSDRKPRLSVSPELLGRVHSRYGLDRASFGPTRFLIGINCGPTWRVREWDVARWQDLIDRLHAEYNCLIVRFGTHISGTPSQYDTLTGVEHLASRLQIDELVGIVALCDLLISIDSGPVHIAGAVGTPIVGLYGALNPHYYLPPDSKSVGVFARVPCLFCHNQMPRGHWKTDCPNGIRCMKELEVETVFQAVCDSLASVCSISPP